MKKIISFILLFVILLVIDFYNVGAEETKRFTEVIDEKGQVAACNKAGSNINKIKICEKGKSCNSVGNVYFCTQFWATYPNKECTSTVLNRPCSAGVAYIIEQNANNIFKKDGTLNPEKAINYDCGYNNYYYTTFLINTFLYKKCGKQSGGRVNYNDLTKTSIYKQAESVYNKVYYIINKKQIIKFDKKALNFEYKNDAFESSVNLSIIENYKIYKGDNNFKVQCSLSGDGVTFANNNKNTLMLTGSQLQSPYNIRIHSNNELESKTITLSCQPKYEHKLTTYYNCGKYQDVVSGKLTGNTVEGDKISITNGATPPAPSEKVCDVELENVLDAMETNDNNRRKKLIELYNYYNLKGFNYPGLLEFDTPCCGDKCTQNDIACLSATSKSTQVYDNNGNPLYCEIDTNIEPSESYFNYINNHGKVYSGELYFSVDEGNLLDGTIVQNCYNKNGEKVDIDFINPNLPKISLANIQLEGKINGNKISYSIDPVYAKLNGKKVTKNQCLKNGNCRFLGYGLLSSMNAADTSEYEFKVNDQTAVCEYTSEPKVVKDNDLQLEFRIIDTDNPFVDKNGNQRNTMTNWCYDVNRIDIGDEDILAATNVQRYLEGIDSTVNDYYKDGNIDAFDALAVQKYNADIDTKCQNNNILVNYYIKEKTNSYNKKYNSNGIKITGDGPKYKITLTPQLMKDITDKYHDKLPYDEFKLECRDKTNLKPCEDSTLEENKVYQTSQLLTYLKETAKVLTINGSTKR